jgi:hypothetical protein
VQPILVASSLQAQNLLTSWCEVYGQLGALLIVTTVLGFIVPMLAIAFVKSTRFRSA